MSSSLDVSERRTPNRPNRGGRSDSAKQKNEREKYFRNSENTAKHRVLFTIYCIQNHVCGISLTLNRS